MAKKKNDVPITEEKVEAVSKSKQIKELVKLAGLFVRIGARGAIETEINVFCSVEVPDKDNPAKCVYRKHNIEPGTYLEPEFVRIGARDGLIFRFTPKNPIDRKGIHIEAVEMQWADVCGVLPEAVVRLNAYFDNQAAEAIAELDARIKEIVQKNPGMHRLLNEGFKKAQENATEEFKEEQLENNELYGLWG